MKKRNLLKMTFCTFIIILSIVLIYLRMNSSKIKISEKQKLAEKEKITVEAKSTKECNVKLYQKTNEDNNFIEVKATEENKGIINTTNTFEIDAKDITSPNNVTEIKSTVVDDYIIISFMPAIDYSTLYEYYIESNNDDGSQKSDITTIYSECGIKGYNYIIDSSKETEAGIEVNKIDSEPILYSGIEWDKDYYLHIRAIDNSGNYSENITYKIDLPSKGLRLKYLDYNSNSEISPEETIIGNVNEEYNISSLEKNLEGYKLINIDGETSGKLKKERINVKFNYAKIANIKVKYIDNLGKELSKTNIIEGYEGKEYSIKAKKIEGYACKNSEVTGNMKAGEEEIVFTYEKIGNVITSYLDETTGKAIIEDVIKSDMYGKQYKTEEKSIEGYELSKVEGKTEGIIDSENIKVTYYYKKLVNMVIKHVDISTNKILEEEKICGLEGENAKIQSKDFEGYTLVTNEDNNNLKNLEEDSKLNQENLLQEEENEYNKETIYKKDNTDDETKSNKDKVAYNNDVEETKIEDKDINAIKVNKNNIIDEIIDDYYEDELTNKKNTNEENIENTHIKQEYDIVLDPNVTEYIIYYKKK